MKRIIIILLTIFLLTGCYDNIELDDLSIITGIGIDYKDDNFYLTYEILNDVKTEENTALLSYTVSGSGKSISEAFIDANYKIGKKAYFAHLKVLVLSEEIINGHFDKITDYFFRDINIRDEFNVVVANGTTPEEILKNNNDNHPVVSELIIDLLSNEKYNNSLAIDDTFQKILSKLISNNYDIILNTISLNDEEISLNNSYIFNGYVYKNSLNKLNSKLYNMLTKNTISVEFDKNYENGNVTISVNGSKTEIDITSDKIIINTKLDGKILENNPEFNLKDTEIYEKLNKDFGNIIKDDINNFVKILQENNSDILGLQSIYYKKYNKENKNLWLNAKIEVNVDLKINTKGFVFEVK